MQRNMFNKTELALENPLASSIVNYVNIGTLIIPSWGKVASKGRPA